MVTHQKHLAEALLMGTHSICFCQEIRKNIDSFLLKKSALSRTMSVRLSTLLSVLFTHATFSFTDASIAVWHGYLTC